MDFENLPPEASAFCDKVLDTFQKGIDAFVSAGGPNSYRFLQAMQAMIADGLRRLEGIPTKEC
jgi:hypothetical protein